MQKHNEDFIEYVVEKDQISLDLIDRARVLGRFLVSVLDVKASKTKYPFDTWRRLKEKLRWRTADLQPCDFRKSYLNFIRNASYRYLPVDAERLFEEAGRVTPNAAAALIWACIDIDLSITFNKAPARGPLVQEAIERLLS